MRIPRPSVPVALWLIAASLFLALMAERATTPVLSRDDYITLLANCGASGRPVEEAVRALGMSERAWGRSVTRHASDPALAIELEQRLARVPDTSSTTLMR